MARKKQSRTPRAGVVRRSNYDNVLADVVDLLESARRASARTVNAIMTATYWQVGRRIVEHEQGGANRADYGETLLKRLAADLTSRVGRGFAWRNLYQMRAFYKAYPEILQTVSAKSIAGGRETARVEKLQTASAIFKDPSRSGQISLAALAQRFPLPWSAYVRLLSVDNPQARQFYETEALRGGWSVRQLDRQIESQFYERTALSRNKTSMLRKPKRSRPEETVSLEEAIKDPFVLEFLGLRDEYSESDLEDSLVLCTERDDALAHYALGNLPNKVVAAKYRTALPEEKLLAAEIAKTRNLLERRSRFRPGPAGPVVKRVPSFQPRARSRTACRPK